MSESVTLAALHAANKARQTEWCKGGAPEPDLAFRGNELAGETGEACNVIKKLERERHGWRGSRATPDQLAEELADVVICADLCAVTAGIDLGAAVVAKFNATSEEVGLTTRLEPAALASTAGAGAGDWVTVPRKITMPMGMKFYEHRARDEDAQFCWEAMIEAAPAVPASPRSGAGEGEEDTALLDMIASGALSVVPQVNGGWVIEDDDGSGEQEVEVVRTRERLRPALREAARTLGWDLPASPPAPAEHGVEIRAISEHQLRELSALADWLERDSSENDADNIRAAVSALSQGGGAGRSEKGEGEDEGRRAIRFAMGLEDHWDRFEFLNAFIGGDLSEWPEFTKPEPAPAQSPSTSDAEG